ncbi:hypothetical protein HID58_051636, partial [Brassica napus]
RKNANFWVVDLLATASTPSDRFFRKAHCTLLVDNRTGQSNTHVAVQVRQLTSATCFSKRQYSSSWVLADAVTANYCLADIFGELTEIRSTLNEDLQSKVRVIATIKIQRLVSLS